jgi:hypothetical protein
LNEFFQQVYGSDYTSRYPKIKLHLDWNNIPAKLQYKNLDLIKSILEPSHSISLVKLKGSGRHLDMVEVEAKIVQQIVDVYFNSRVKNVSPSQIPVNRDVDEPSVMIVTPHNKQRIAIKKRVGSVPVDTVEKMQGQECDLIIACFSCSNKRAGGYQFLRDFRRWNVALSRAR